MKEKQIKTNYNYRLNKLKEDSTCKLNWLFLPGGPGMGANYLIDFVSKLELQGSMFVGDFPGDGDNRDFPKGGDNRNNEEISYYNWKEGLIEVVNKLKPCILVTHSFSGMFALTIGDLENLLTGLVIINSAPNSSWIELIKDTATKYNLPDLTDDINELYKNPTDEQLKTFFYANIPYIFCEHEISEGKKILELCSYSITTRLWANQNFYNSYKYSWIPNKLPTLIIGSRDDKLLPIKLFLENTEWSQPHPNINIIELHNTGHFPWLSCFTQINEELSGLTKDINELL
ncbi:MAG TPA: alpha/beta hydrolase [Rickettsia endosymbiont of Pyrocoelia pectoralis]|nr:alpha/beta hydrolase [Rickettsia endosymbiont of Pyrocoelia pectoralis]